MKIIIEIDCTVEGKWLEKYEDELVQKVKLPGAVVCGGENGCDVIFETETWTFVYQGGLENVRTKR